MNWNLVDEWMFPEGRQIEYNHAVDRNLMIERKNVKSPDRKKTHLKWS